MFISVRRLANQQPTEVHKHSIQKRLNRCSADWCVYAVCLNVRSVVVQAVDCNLIVTLVQKKWMRVFEKIHPCHALNIDLHHLQQTRNDYLIVTQCVQPRRTHWNPDFKNYGTEIQNYIVEDASSYSNKYVVWWSEFEFRTVSESLIKGFLD